MEITKARDIDEYIASFPEETQKKVAANPGNNKKGCSGGAGKD